MKTIKVFGAAILIFSIVACDSNSRKKEDMKRPDKSGKASIYDVGNTIGYGNKVVICGKKIELLDLYEARKAGQTPIAVDNYETGTKQLAKKFFRYSIDVISTHIPPLKNLVDQADDSQEWNETAQNLLDVAGKDIKDIPATQSLKLVDDKSIEALPKNCTLEQLDIRAQDKSIYRDSNLWKKLSITDQAAATFHYTVNALTEAKWGYSPKETRLVVGKMLTNASVEALYEVLRDQEVSRCSFSVTEDSELLISTTGMATTKDGIEGKTFYFDVLNTANQYLKKSVFVPQEQIIALNQGQATDLEFKIESELGAGVPSYVQFSTVSEEVDGEAKVTAKARVYSEEEKQSGKIPEYVLGECFATSQEVLDAATGEGAEAPSEAQPEATAEDATTPNTDDSTEQPEEVPLTSEDPAAE